MARNALQATLLLKGDGGGLARPLAYPQGRRRNLHTSNDRLCGVKSHILHEVALFVPNTAHIKEYNLQKITNPTVCAAVPME
jgi:hypothetical protein